MVSFNESWQHIAAGILFGYGCGIALGISVGKLSHLGPLLRGTWYTTFWGTVVFQTVLIVALASHFFLRPIPVSVATGLLVASVLIATPSLGVTILTMLLPRNSDGEEDTPSVSGTGSAPSSLAGFDPLPFGIVDGEGCAIALIAVVVCVLVLGLSYIPLWGIVRVTSRIAYHGILKA